jgi:hypothetical protein
LKFSLLLARLSARGKLLAFMNFVFFGSFFLFVILFDAMLYPSLYPDLELPFSKLFSSSSIYLVILSVFLSNLFLSAIAIVTLPGFVFFPLSAGFLLFRSFIWGFLFCQQPTWVFLVAVPTLIIEGEAYCIAAVCGTVVGASWVKPKWIFIDESLNRIGALKKALEECVWLYVFVVLLLSVAAVIEAITFILIINLV